MTLRARTVCLSLAAAQLGACDQQGSQENETLAATLHYKEAHPAATAKSASVQVQTRALLDRDGFTHIDVTTGAFESTQTPTGTLSMVKVQLLEEDDDDDDKDGDDNDDNDDNDDGDDDDDDDKVVVQNEKVDASTVSFTVGSLDAGQSLRIQVHVVDGDGKKQVLKITDVVRKRPDPAIEEVVAPDEVSVGDNVTVSTDITELNQDIGATLDCVLLVDGAQVDLAKNVYVDAGDTVSCSFAYTFKEKGTHTVAVELQNVLPTDWNPDNNRAETTVEVLVPAVQMNYWAYAGEGQYAYYSRGNGTQTYTTSKSSTQWTWDYQGGGAGAYQSVAVYAYINGVRWNFPLESISFSESSDGEELTRVEIAPLERKYTYTYAPYGLSYECGWTYSAGLGVSACAITYQGRSYSSVSAYRYAGTVVYWSRGHTATRVNGKTTTYSWNVASAYMAGTFKHWGSSVSLDLLVTDDGVRYEADPDIALKAFSYNWTYPWTCWKGSWSQYTWNSCWEGSYTGSGRFGYAVRR